MTIQKFAFIRNQFIDWQEFTKKYSWATIEDDLNLPEKCVSIYYSVDLEKQVITERLCMVSYSSKYQPDFKKISVAWVDEYFSVEPADLMQLDKPKETIIQPGGEIFCLLNDQGQVVGTVAMIIEHDGAVELAKMGVGKEFCGKGYAHPLMKEAIMWAQNRSYKYINLYTATKLIVAVSLYEKYDFKAISFRPHSHFARVDLAMRLTF
ncbi:acyl-CoA N-acyltransferase [Thamnidium elegans]|nr:acyl-CoA N-acyltransferase [Thamnidium elegans]